MTLLELMRHRGGVVRTSEVLDLGHTRRDVRRHLEAGRLTAPLRGWISLADADPALVFAVRHHVVLSCVTQARRLKLWVRDPERSPHVAPYTPHGRAPASDAVVHWRRPWVLRPPHSLVDPIENVLQCVAECRPRESALVVWESAMNRGLVDAAGLFRLPLSGRARRVLESCTPFSDSGLETLVVSRLRWLPVRVLQQIHVRGHRVDVLVGARLVVQIDGASHTGEKRDEDNLNDAVLKQMNYTVIRVSYRQVLYEWETVQGLVLGAVARGHHLA